MKSWYFPRLENRDVVFWLGIIKIIRLCVARPKFWKLSVVRFKFQVLQSGRKVFNILARSNLNLKRVNLLKTCNFIILIFFIYAFYTNHLKKKLCKVAIFLLCFRKFILIIILPELLESKRCGPERQQLQHPSSWSRDDRSHPTSDSRLSRKKVHVVRYKRGSRKKHLSTTIYRSTDPTPRFANPSKDLRVEGWEDEDTSLTFVDEALIPLSQSPVIEKWAHFVSRLGSNRIDMSLINSTSDYKRSLFNCIKCNRMKEEFLSNFIKMKNAFYKHTIVF